MEDRIEYEAPPTESAIEFDRRSEARKPAGHASDRDLVERCARREPEAWDVLYRKYVNLVAFMILKTLRARGRIARPEEVEDLTMDVFAHLLEDDCRVLRGMREPFNIKTWLAVSARRRAIDITRKRDRYISAIDESLGGEAPDRAVEDREEFLGLLREVPLRPRERLVVTLFYFTGGSYSEISRATGISTDSVGPHLFRARRKIRETMRRSGW